MTSVEGKFQDAMNTLGIRTRVWNFLSSLYNTITFSFVNPLLKKGSTNELDEHSAMTTNPLTESICDLQTEFFQLYTRFRKDFENSTKKSFMNPVLRALIKQHTGLLLLHVLYTIGAMCFRLLGPLSIRWFLMWLSDYKDGEAKGQEGWLWGFLIVVSSVGMTLFNNHSFWIGFKLGWKAKMSMIGAVHAKLLRLNSSSVAKITTGHVVNLASNDVQRLNEVSYYWLFAILGPLETILILIMVSYVLGFLPAISGISCALVLIPLQSVLSRQIGRYRTRVSKITDKRINFMSELISGSLAVKMLGWEDPLLEEVNGIRSKEHRLLKKINYIRANALALTGHIQTIMACVTFVVYRFTREEFKIEDVLFAISLFYLPRLWMAMFFTLAIQNHSELLVSTRRLNAFFMLPEVYSSITRDEAAPQKGGVLVQDGNYGWYSAKKDDIKKQKSTRMVERMLSKVSSKGKARRQSAVPELIQTLRNVNYHLKPGELVGIAGKVGSGKSSLLSALLNDMENLNPEHLVQITGSVSYCAQVPWIMAATVRDNIVFGNEFNEPRYDRVISSCALEVDFEQFPFGDQTEIGERGINLSGGQKARIALARSAYSNADVNLLDDPLSAVDPKVGRILFERCIGGKDGLMKNSTRLLVTHQKQFLPLCDRIILMNQGQIECIGTWNELADHYLLNDMERTDSSADVAAQRVPSDHLTTKQMREPNSARGSGNDSDSEIQKADNKNSSKNSQKQLVEKEGKASGQVSRRVYKDFVIHIGVLPMILTFVAMLTNRVFYFGTEWWISAWASTDENDQQEHKWIWVLLGSTGVSVVSVTLAMFAMFGLLTIGSTRLHKQMAKRVVHAPLSFFHTNPSGRILNRFSKDTGIQDDELPQNAAEVVLLTIHVAGSMIVVSIALPYIIPMFLVIIYLFQKLRSYFVVTAREIRRYDAITRSPVYAMLSANIKALPTIHAFQKEEQFHSMFLRSLDVNGSWWMAFLGTSRWVAFRMDCFVSAVCILSVILAVSLADEVREEILGLALVYVIAASGVLQWWMRQTAELESRMTCVERNLEYTRLDQEPPRASEGGGTAPPDWPSKGTIEYSYVTVSYRPGLDPVLKQLQFVIPGGSSVGIVGRTGSGKSSLLLSLFRLIDINEGIISIDGIDTSSIGIDVLRKQLAIIPQDPTLFGGTFRTNLDPWSEFSDAQVWKALENVHLSETVEGFGGIGAPVAENGNNLSVGQKQLLCLARALLADSKILALDEATANVDRATDSLIQDSLHALITGNEKTLLIIAHRVDTVLDCDFILVLDDGRMVEFGSPESLLSRANGLFKGMADAAKEASNIKGHND